MLKFIDSHAHYDDRRYDADRDELLHRLHKGGVEKIINMGCTLKRSELSVKLARKYPFIYAAVGIHPSDVNDTADDYLDILKGWLSNEKVVAVGEIGLDYHYDNVVRSRQIRFFEEQLELAATADMPVIIHSRDATEDTLRILREFKNKHDSSGSSLRGGDPLRGVMHCFSGSAETAKEVLDLGLYISFTGVVTFKNARKALEALEIIPLDRLLLETDCPYMAPEPHRGERCDSGMVTHIIEKIAEVKGVTPELIANVTSDNTCKLFNLI